MWTLENNCKKRYLSRPEFDARKRISEAEQGDDGVQPAFTEHDPDLAV
jgi:hypothetical protein